ncbi:MAG: GNAT family N-acetyltransferase [Actinobacteria bacterium]|nr:GNAT family N-acetyltransferase [Actinomycetota bacterium]
METIRPARKSEAEQLAELHVKTWQQAYAGLLPDQYLASLESSQRLPMWQHLLASPERVAIFVAESDSRPIGFSCGGGPSEPASTEGVAELWSIYLLKEFWDKGIGKRLHDALLDELKSRAFREVFLWVMESNARTREWYERQGWTLDGGRKTDELWGATITEVRYRKDLG